MITIAGYVEAAASLFGVGVLEDGLRQFLAGEAPIVYCGRADEVFGQVTHISGRGERIEVQATLEQPPSSTPLADAFNKIRSGTVKGLAIDGVFTRDHAEVHDFSVAPLTPSPGTGLITSVTG